MAGDLLPQPIYLFLHSHVPDCKEDLLDAHLLVDEVICIWIECFFASLKRRFEVFHRERHRLAILFHEIA